LWAIFGLGLIWPVVPFHAKLKVGGKLQEISGMNGWTSPLLGVRFELSSGELKFIGPDGRPFATYVELVERAHQAELKRKHAEFARQRAESERQRAESEQQRAKLEHQRAELAYQRAERLAAKLRELGIDPTEL